MQNPYLQLHKVFRNHGADVLISSGQACVLLGIAAFSKDGDWIIREDPGHCRAVLEVLAERGAAYRLGAPLDPVWLKLGWTSHFEYFSRDGQRMRVDFCSRPPRIDDIEQLWSRSTRIKGFDMVDVDSLARLKMTRRLRDYSIIGAIADVAGYSSQVPEIALQYLWDYDLLQKAVKRWPDVAETCEREAVKLLIRGASRSEVVVALALEQDQAIQADQERIQSMRARMAGFRRRFIAMRAEWRKVRTPLLEQHQALLDAAGEMLS